jgi:hypothetical protein
MKSPAAGIALLLLALASAPLESQLSSQSFQVRVDSGTVTVGDTVRLRFRMRLDERDLLLDSTPEPLISGIDGIRVLSVDRLARDKDRIFHGEALVAFYRTGRQAAPAFTVTFMRVVAGVRRGVLASDTAWVEVTPVAPAGDQTLKDLRPLEAFPLPRWPWLLLVPVVAWAWRLLRPGPGRRAVTPDPVPSTPDRRAARREALDLLREIEAAGPPPSDATDTHCEAVANVVRDFLGRSERIRTRELTTRELVRSISSRRGVEPALEGCETLLAKADLVKFAAASHEPESALRFLHSARELVEEWPIDQDGVDDAAR